MQGAARCSNFSPPPLPLAVAAPLALVLLAVTTSPVSQASTALAGGPSVEALDTIPPAYLTVYLAAAPTCPGLPWAVLAGIGRVESDHGQSTAPGVHSGANYAGAEGPMQFEPATFARYAVNADRPAPLTPYDPADAIYTAAAMLCANGATSGTSTGIRQAIYAYNHAQWYVTDVLAWAARYTVPPPAKPPPPPSPSPPARSASPTNGVPPARTPTTAPGWCSPPTPRRASTSPAPPTSGARTAHGFA